MHRPPGTKGGGGESNAEHGARAVAESHRIQISDTQSACGSEHTGNDRGQGGGCLALDRSLGMCLQLPSSSSLVAIAGSPQRGLRTIGAGVYDQAQAVVGEELAEAGHGG